jgi:hypothetical protein
VLFDEYESVRFPGARKAIDEYFGERRQLIARDGASGRHYLAKPLES